MEGLKQQAGCHLDNLQTFLRDQTQRSFAAAQSLPPLQCARIYLLSLQNIDNGCNSVSWQSNLFASATMQMLADSHTQSATITGKENANKTSSKHLKQGSKVLNISGTWIKDRKRSDSLDGAMQLVRMSGLLRTAVRLIKGMDIQQTDEMLTLKIFSFISWFKVTERYPLNGDPAKVKRRDLRRGHHIGRLTCDPSGKSLMLRNVWPDPVGGIGVDIFTMPEVNELHVHCTITVGNKTQSYLNVYTRKGSGKVHDEHLDEKELEAASK